MATTYQSAYAPKRSLIVRRTGAAARRQFNNPDQNYDDPAWKKPPFVSRLQPLSFTSSMAPERVAYCPVPLAYPGADAAQSPAEQPHSARFSTTSLASRRAAEAAEDVQRLGMSGAEAFRFALRAEQGSFTSRPQRTKQSHSNYPPTSTSRKEGLTDPRVSARLPIGAFHYHVNHTKAMLRENARQASFRSPTAPSIIVTSNVYPRAPSFENTNKYAPPNAPRETLFPVAFNPGHLSSTARKHAFDVNNPAAAMEPIYDSFPLHPHQREFRLNPHATSLRLDAATNKYVPVYDQPVGSDPGSVTQVGSHTLNRSSQLVLPDDAYARYQEAAF